MSAVAVLTVFSVMVGIVLTAWGATTSLHQWVSADHGVIKTRRDYLGSSLTGLSMVVEAINHHPQGQRFILLGIVVLVIAAILGGITTLESACA